MAHTTRRMGRGGAWWLALGLVLGGLGIALWAGRILTQGDVVVWTDIARSFWVPDPTLGWVETSERWVWLGLDGLGVAAGAVVGASALAWLARRLGRNPARGGRWVEGVGVLSLVGAGVSASVPVLPVWAFVSGLPPAGAERLLPSAPPPAAPVVAEADDALGAAAGRWVIAPSPHNLLIARIAAGGETFDARFAPVSGEITLEPAALARSWARLEAPASSIDTGIELRDGHARGYLETDKHPLITLAIGGLDSVQGSGTTRSFTARGELAIMGRELEVAIAGTLSAPDETGIEALGVADGPVLLVSAGFSVDVHGVGLDRDNFDADTITLTGRFVLVPDDAARGEGTL